jgi:hypothetical protein
MNKKDLWGIVAAVLLIAALGLVAGCGGGGGAACRPGGCSGHGSCEVNAGVEACVCDQGYQVTTRGDECIASVCAGQTCSGHGTCVPSNNQPFCSCDLGYTQSADKLGCLPSGSCQDDGDCTTPPTATCQGTTLKGYALPGACSGGQCQYTAADKECGGRGCCTDRCCGLIPSNVATFGGLEPTGQNKNIGSASFDTVNGCTAGSALGTCLLVSPTGTAQVCVCRSDSLSVTGTLRVTGDAALALFVYNTVTISGCLDLSASGTTPGPGGVVNRRGDSAQMQGGSGGTNGTKGGGLSDDVSGGASLVPLVGGQGGQGGCNGRTPGAGAGAVQISAGESIQLSGTILALGAGGQGGNGESDPAKTCLGGAGGGSGGSILLEAPAVTVSGSGAVYANGGGGGGGGSSPQAETGGDGGDASASLNAAAGGAGRDGHGCALYGLNEGGEGGVGGVNDQPGGDGEAYEELQCEVTFDKVGGGGGGGGVGKIRINTSTNCSCGGTFSPTFSPGHAQGT